MAALGELRAMHKLIKPRHRWQNGKAERFRKVRPTAALRLQPGTPATALAAWLAFTTTIGRGQHHRRLPTHQPV